MIFKIDIKSDQKNFLNRRGTALLKFFRDKKSLNKEVTQSLKDLHISLNNLQFEEFIADNDEIWHYNHKSSPDLLILNKIKIDKNLTVDYFRDYLAGLIPKLKGKGITHLQVDLPEYNEYSDIFKENQTFISSFIEGIYLGNYSFDVYKNEKKAVSKLTVNLEGKDQKILKRSISATGKIMDAVYFARDLSIEPAITLTPKELVARTRNSLRSANIKLTVFNKRELIKRKMGAILAVGSASVNEPYLMIIHYKPKAKAKKKIALVGKGVTYDSGGLSIKTTKQMIDMNADMSGASTVIGTIKAASAIELPVEIIGVIPAVENMVSGGSYKPGDIVRTASGKSIEVQDTDAEGRIILADALEYASNQKPDEIIDFATLTGAVIVALGEFLAGLFTQNEDLAERIISSGETTYERVWRMPFGNEFNSHVDSKIADVANLGRGYGGAITAGKFLERFVDDKIPWAHIDIAGCAIKHKYKNYTENYNTGFGVRLMVKYLSNL